MSTKNSDSFGGVVFGLILLTFLFAWLTIPSEKNEVNAFQVSSLTFANGVFDGWADDLAIKLFHSESNHNKESARIAFRGAILKGEQEFPLATTIFNLLGAFFSVGGLIAVWLARSAANTSEAFTLGFWAEIIESLVFHIGYYKTVGSSSVTGQEVLITIVVAVIMGFVAQQVNKKYGNRTQTKTA